MGEGSVASEGPKIAPHTLTHTGVIVQQRESERESEGENTQHGQREEEKYRSAEEEGTRGRVGQRG